MVSILLYNCNSWSATKVMLNKLDVTHRKHLRHILNIKWPTGVISNRALYKRCNVSPLSKRVENLRWRMFGHVLRSDDTTPANLSLRFAVEEANNFQGRLGRPHQNLYKTLLNDLKARNINLNNAENLNELREIAKNRAKWKEMF